MKIKIATSLEGLRTAMAREYEAQMQIVTASVLDAVHASLDTSLVAVRETDLLIDAVEQQIAVWETLAARDESS